MKKNIKSDKIGKSNRSLFGVFGRLNGKRAYIALLALVVLFSFSLAAKHISIKEGKIKSSFNDDAWNKAVSDAELKKQENKAIADGAQEKAEEPKERKLPVSENSASAEKENEPEVAAVFAEEVSAAETAESSGEKAFEKPSKGKVLKAFSGDELVYSETMDDWRTHNGIDYAAAAGDQVLCAADGKVSKVYKDDMLGIVVTVDHGDGITTLYSNLQSTDFIKEGKDVKKGDIIGGIGECGGLERSDAPHLHFELMKNGEYENPEQYFSR